MITIQRLIQKVVPGKRAELEALTKKFEPFERRLGLPVAKRYECLSGGHDWNTIILEREWESLAVMEATFEKCMADPEYQALSAQLVGLVESEQLELYTPLP